MSPDMRPISMYAVLSCGCKENHPANGMGGHKSEKGLTEIVFTLDRSGSMSGLESGTIGGL